MDYKELQKILKGYRDDGKIKKGFKLNQKKDVLLKRYNKLVATGMIQDKLNIKFKEVKSLDKIKKVGKKYIYDVKVKDIRTSISKQVKSYLLTVRMYRKDMLEYLKNAKSTIKNILARELIGRNILKFRLSVNSIFKHM